MDSAFLNYLYSFVLGIVGGILSGYGLRFGIGRRCTRLEWAVGDIQQRLSNLQGRKAAVSRWEREAVTGQELEALLTKGTPPRKRYDNDPLGE